MWPESWHVYPDCSLGSLYSNCSVGILYPGLKMHKASRRLCAAERHGECMLEVIVPVYSSPASLRCELQHTCCMAMSTAACRMELLPSPGSKGGVSSSGT